MESFVSISLANEGQTTCAISGLTAGIAQFFIVSRRALRNEDPDSSPRSRRIALRGERSVCTGDRDSLESLYNSTDGSNWKNSSNWLNNAVPFGEWQGVTTDSVGCGLVLILECNGLAGEMPKELAGMNRPR